jgi:50S ribosomal subunit-associated GTPase HflX
MKTLKVVGVILVGFGMLYIVHKIRLLNAELENLEREKAYFIQKDSVLTNKVFDVSHANIILRNQLTPRQERELRKDSVYLKLIDKHN